MESGQVFKVDSAAIDELASFYKKPREDFEKLEGQEYSISKSKLSSAITDKEVRGTKWEEGKPQRGRPRKFPRTTVARLLGELDDASLQEPEEAEVVEETAEAEVEAESTDLEAEAEKLVAAEATEDSDGDSW